MEAVQRTVQRAVGIAGHAVRVRPAAAAAAAAARRVALEPQPRLVRR